MCIAYVMLYHGIQPGGMHRAEKRLPNEFRSDEDLADEMAEKIVGCIEAEDADALQSCFQNQYGTARRP